MIDLFWYIVLFLLVSPILVMGGIIIGGIALGLNQVLHIKAIPAVLMSLGLIYLVVR